MFIRNSATIRRLLVGRGRRCPVEDRPSRPAHGVAAKTARERSPRCEPISIERPIMRKTNRLRQGLILDESLPMGAKKPALMSESRLCNYVWTAALELGRRSLELSLIMPQRWHVCIALPPLLALAHHVARNLLLVGLASQGLIALTHFS